ncbi:DUF6470 family protein [Paenibacillus sedimenti]|uniref:Uncharacterized protein n=1 Tax=Paenibacillus sedimenti TaxID=2770274 RepID=A0A926KVZ7_9BACL|nr:DUF6470 family protein [Paenibacillus sedimenti]MBD0384181.1 hypothetical protein [Paenibacillus sedimenti]
MVTFPQIEIRQQYAKLGIDADHAKIEQEQPKATFEMRRTAPKLEMSQPLGELNIDQSKAWDAYGRGGILTTMNRIYSEAENVALQGIARIVERGNRLADITSKRNAIVENAMELVFTFPELRYEGPASYDNVDITYTARKPEIHVTDGHIDLTTHPNPPELRFQRGKLEMYMMQHANVEIIPPVIDQKI